MRRAGLILAGLLFLSGCAAPYGPGTIMTAPPDYTARAVTDAPRADELDDPMGELEAAFSAYAPRGAGLADLVTEPGVCRYEILPASGTSYQLANREDSAWDELDDTAAKLQRLTRDVRDHLADIGEDAAVCALLLNDQAPELVLLAVRDGEILYDVRDELPDASPGHEPAEYYVLNTSTKRIHNPWCPEISKIDPRNRKASMDDLHALLLDDYVKCESDGDWDLTEPTYPSALSVGIAAENLPEGVTAP